MAAERIDAITARYSVLQSLSASDLEDSLEHIICCTQTTQAQIAAEMNKLQEEPAQQAEQVANLQAKDQQLAEIMEEEMHLQQVEEVKAQSQEIQHLLPLVELHQEGIQKLTYPKSPTREPTS